MNKQTITDPSRLIYPVTLIAALIVNALPTMVSAQALLEEITVTATRRAQTIQDIPYNISAMTGDQLEAAGVLGIADLSRAIPGIAFSDLGVRSGGVNNQLILRGLNVNAQGGIGAYIANLNPAGVSTYMDNTPLFTNLRMTDLERVEVLRGPQGTLYGAGSVGGTLRFIFNKPNPEAFAAKINTSFGAVEDSDDLNYGVDGMVNVPLGDTAAIRISAGYEQTAGFIDGNALAVGDFRNPQIADPTDPFGTGLLTESREDLDEANQWYLRASVLWEMSESFQAQLTYHRQEDDAESFSYQQNAGWLPGARERTHNLYFTTPLDREVDLVSLDLSLDLGFSRLESATSYTKNKEINAGELSGLYMGIDASARGFALGGFPTTNGRLSAYYLDDHQKKSVVQELRLISQGESKLEWVAGFFYEDNSHSTSSFSLLPGFADYANTPGHPFAALLGAPPFLSWANLVAGFGISQAGIDSELIVTTERQIDVEDIALFGELTYHFSNAWQVTFGARVFWNEYKHDLTNTAPVFGARSSQDGTDPTGLNQSSSKDETQDQIFKVNTSYEFNDDLMTYFTWSEGFRRGGNNAIVLQGFNAENPANRTFVPDTVTNYEIGVKGVLFDKLRYTAAIFRIDWDKPQLSGTFIPSGNAAVYNAEEARTQGLELEGQWLVSDAVQLSLGYTYTDAEFTKDFATALGPGDLAQRGGPDAFGSDGESLPGVPDHMATWALDYERPVNFMGESMIHFRVDGSYRGSVVTWPSPAHRRYVELPGFDMWNASLTWSNDHWRVGTYVKNITDEIGVTQVLRDFELRAVDRVDFISRPRTIGVMLGYTY